MDCCGKQCEQCEEGDLGSFGSRSPVAEQPEHPDLESLSLGGLEESPGRTGLNGMMQVSSNQPSKDLDEDEENGADRVHRNLSILTYPSHEGTLRMRGVSLRKTLSQAMSFWLADPSARTQEEKTRLYRASVPTSRLDMFVSHTWLTPGKWKFLSLLLQFGWPTVLICWLLGVVLGFVLCMTEVLPLFRAYQVRALDFAGVIHSGCWSQIFGFLGILGGCILFPQLPCSKSDQCFLDFACIHQTEKYKMQQGIMSISAFLAGSEELRVLWSSPLLSRLWCVFEIAAYRKLKPDGKIVIAPVDNEASACRMFLWWQGSCFVFWIGRSGPDGGNPLLLLVLMGGIFAALMPALALAVWRNHKSTAKLRSDLANFDVMNADCTSEFDRECIHNAITTWYGSLEAFSEHVRGPISCEVLELMRTSGSVSCHYIILPITPLVCLSLDNVVALWKAGSSAKSVLSVLFNHVVALDLLFFPAMGVFFSWITKKGLWLGKRRCQPFALEIGIILVLCVTSSVSAAWLCVVVSIRSMEMTLLWNVLALLFAALVRCFCWRSR